MKTTAMALTQKKAGGGVILAPAVTALVVVVGIVISTTFEGAIGYFSIAALSLAPGIVWVVRGAQGIPVFPAVAAMHYIYFAVPIAKSNFELRDMLFSTEEVLQASVTICLFLVGAIAAWALVAGNPAMNQSQPDGNVMAKRVVQIVFLGLIAGLGYFMAIYSNWLDWAGAFFGAIRGAFLTAAALASFLLGHARARGSIRGRPFILACGLLIILVLLSWGSLFLVGGATFILAAMLGYIITARRIPWRFAIIVLALISVLHAGKGEMRTRYWEKNANFSAELSVRQIPGIMIEWIAIGIENLASGEGASAVDRASLIQMVLFVERASPDYVPFLEGRTYAYLPNVILPRFLDSNKVATQIGQTLLNIQYGLQTVETAAVTAIGWGPIAEGYANFGNIGVLGAGFFVGLLSGLFGRWSIGAPIFSLPAFASIAVMMTMINLEADLVYLISNLLQALGATLIFVFGINSSLGRRKGRSLGVAPRC